MDNFNRLPDGGKMTKRMLDWLEKISAGSMLIGFFQGSNEALILGLLTFCATIIIEGGWK